MIAFVQQNIICLQAPVSYLLSHLPSDLATTQSRESEGNDPQMDLEFDIVSNFWTIVILETSMLHRRDFAKPYVC